MAGALGALGVLGVLGGETGGVGVTGGAEATAAGVGSAGAAACSACGAACACAGGVAANGSWSGASATSLRGAAPLVAFNRPAIDGGRLRPAPKAAAKGELVIPTLGSAATSPVDAPAAPATPA